MKKFAAILAVSLIVILLSLWGIGFYLSPEDPLSKSDAIVVISGGETSRRVDEGIALYKNGWAPKIIFSGAAAEGSVSNAKSMARVAYAKGVPQRDVLLEESALNTYENAIYAKKIIGENNLRSIILVTSPYHERRAGIIFRHMLGKEFPIVRRIAADSRWRRQSWFVSSYGRQRTGEEVAGIFYFYSVQKNLPQD